jgi:hypothetical protein
MKWKTTSTKIKNGRRPQKNKKWKTTSKKIKMEEDLKKMEENLTQKNGRRPQKKIKKNKR